MCWPGPHSNNCEERGKTTRNLQDDTCMERDRDRPPSKLQSAIYYTLDGDQVNILTLLAQRCEDPWVDFYFACFSITVQDTCRMGFLELGNLCFTRHVKEVPGDAHSSSLRKEAMKSTF